ncbi:MAG: haloacid dehalogenase type II [Hyphomicrobiaceae bacterium]
MTSTSTYVFDAYGTLFDVHSASARHADAIGPSWERFSQIWRTKHLEYTWIYAQTGRHTAFRALLEQSLETAIAMVGGIPAGLRGQLLAAYLELDAYSEVPAILDHLKTRGYTTAILTNGDPDMIETAARSAGIRDKLDQILTVHEIGVFKPDMRVYRLVTDRLGAGVEAVQFHSSNRWDAVGAKVFGFGTVWVNRTAQPLEYPETPPDRIEKDLSFLLAV